MGDELEEMITYHAPTEEAKKRHQAIRATILNTLHEIKANVPESNERDYAYKSVREALMWANAGIALNHDML